MKNSIDDMNGIDSAAKLVEPSIILMIDGSLPIEGESRLTLISRLDIHSEIQNHGFSLNDAEILEKPVNDYLIIAARRN